MDRDQWRESVYQALESEAGGIRHFESALSGVVNPEMREAWEDSLDRKRHHELILAEAWSRIR